MPKRATRIQDSDFTTPEASHGLLRVFDYLWTEPPSSSEIVAPHVPERRSAIRHDPATLTLPARAQVHPGIDVHIVDVSSSGALLESRMRLSPGMPLRLILGDDGSEETAADGLVLRCSLHAILADHVVYRIALRFF